MAIKRVLCCDTACHLMLQTVCSKFVLDSITRPSCCGWRSQTESFLMSGYCLAASINLLISQYSIPTEPFSLVITELHNIGLEACELSIRFPVVHAACFLLWVFDIKWLNWSDWIDVHIAGHGRRWFNKAKSSLRTVLEWHHWQLAGPSLSVNGPYKKLWSLSRLGKAFVSNADWLPYSNTCFDLFSITWTCVVKVLCYGWCCFHWLGVHI